MRTRGWLIVGIAAAAAFLLVGRAVTSLVVDHAWYTAMGVPGLWWERLADSVLLQGGTWALGSAFAFVNLHAVRRTILAVAVPSRVANIELTAMIPGRRLLGITIVLAALIGLALCAPLTDWTPVALARHGIPFAEMEAFLERDLGFYVYWLPLEETLYLWSLVTVVTLTAIVLVLYALTRSLRLDGRRLIASSHVRRHLSVLGAIVLLLLAWSYRLDAFDVLRLGSGPQGEFLRVDHVVTLRVDLALAFLCGIAALVVLRAGWLGQLRVAFVTLSIVLVSALGLRHTLPALLQRGSTIGAPGTRDVDYVATRALVSRRAYDVDGMRSPATNARGDRRIAVPVAELDRAVSLWDAPAVRMRLSDGSRAARERPPVGFLAGADGALTVLYARRPAPGADSWTLRLADGTQPVLRDSALDVRNQVSDSSGFPTYQEPNVAPGAQGHRLLRDSTGRVLGTSMSGLAMRVAHAWAMRDPSLLDADSMPAEPTRFVSHRDVRERLELLAPVFAQGQDVLPLVHDGVLYWTVDLYSASDSYPLSERWLLAGEVRSYFRHAATGLVEAATGRVRLVASERPDPIARTWMAVAPRLFVSARDLPPSLVDRLPPPTDGALAQIRTFALHGSRAQGPTSRIVADSVLTADGPTPHLAPSDSGRVLAFSVPMLDGAEQLGGMVTAVGGRHRGTYWDSTTAPRARWSAMIERLRGALDSARATLPDGNRREPRLRPGAVQAIMSDRGALLVQPLQWNRGDGSVVISRVAVLIDARVGVGMTLADALGQMGDMPVPRRPAPPVDDPTFGESRDASVARLYEAMRQAMRRSDWTRFGEAFDSLGRVLGRPPQ